jgi:hypothetical protein
MHAAMSENSTVSDQFSAVHIAMRQPAPDTNKNAQNKHSSLCDAQG